MRNSKEFMNDFMNNLESGKYKKEICPQNDEKVFIPTKENVEKELENFSKMLDNEIIESIMYEDKTLVLKK